MSEQTRVVLKAAFEQGDRPQGSDFVDLMDSFVNLSDSTAQTMTSQLVVPGLTINGAVTATNMLLSGTVQAAKLTITATATLYEAQVANRITWGSVAGSELSVNGTARCVALNIFAGSITAYTSAETSAFFAQVGNPNMAAVKFVKVVINGSAYSMPLFRGSIAG